MSPLLPGWDASGSVGPALGIILAGIQLYTIQAQQIIRLRLRKKYLSNQRKGTIQSVQFGLTDFRILLKLTICLLQNDCSTNEVRSITSRCSGKKTGLEREAEIESTSESLRDIDSKFKDVDFILEYQIENFFRGSSEKHEWKFGRTGNDVGSECFHQFSCSPEG